MLITDTVTVTCTGSPTKQHMIHRLAGTVRGLLDRVRATSWLTPRG